MGIISVIIPVYNTEDYIKDCIISLEKQTYENIEIIIINDSSNYKCTQLLESLSRDNNKIKLFHFEERKGVGAARNFGVKQSSGKYIYFLDSDDYLPSHTIEILVRNIKEKELIRGRMHTTNFNKSFAILFDGLYNVKMFHENKYNLIRNNSVQNFLFKKSFIDRNSFKFAEDIDVYSDLNFMIPVLINVDVIPYVKEAIYFRRRRSEPILNPSLSQSSATKKINNFLHMFISIKSVIEDKEANEFLDRHFLNFYRKDIVTHFKDDSAIKDTFPKLHQAVRKLSMEIINEYDFILKKEINILDKGILSKYKRVNNRHHFLRDLRQGMKSKEKFFTFLYRRCFQKLKTKENLVFLESFQGRSYSDNPKYIYEYMIDNNLKYKFVWSVREEQKIPGNHIQVKTLSLRYFYYLARAKYWVLNSRLPNFINKRNDTTYLQTWHGTPLKRLAGDMENVYMPGTNSANYKTNFFNEAQKWDYLISPNAYSSGIFRRAFWFDSSMIESGYPRNDILYNRNNKEGIDKLKVNMGLPLHKKVILYAPTWRDDEFYSKGQYKFELQLDLKKMQQELGDDYIIVLRMHYFIASQMDISDFEYFAYDYSHYNDIGHLYLVSDILITDYSSVFFDYANLKRPILFYTYDIEKYRDTLRGFYINMKEEVPGPLLMNTKEVISAVKNVEEVADEYEEKYNLFYKKFCAWDDGNAARKTVKEVFENE